MCVYKGVHMCAGAFWRPEEGASDPLKLELWVVISCLTWVLGSELGSSVRAANFLNLGAMCPVPREQFLFLYHHNERAFLLSSLVE